MAFWNRPKKVEQKSVVLGTTEALGSFLVMADSQSGSTASSAFNLYEKSSAVSIPINMIVDSFAQLEPVIIMDDRKIVDHPLLNFLRKPSPYYTSELLLDVLGRDYLVTGECFVVALGQINRPPLELQPISPKNLTVPPVGNQGTAAHFSVSGRTLLGTYLPERFGQDIRYIYEANDLREMKQIRNYSSRNNSLLRGMSLLVSASRDAKQNILGTEHNISILEKGGRISLMFNFSEEMDPEDFEVAKDRIISQYGGSSKGGQLGFSAGGGLKVEELSKTNKDMDFMNLQKIAQKSIALQYRVPLPLVSDERMTMGNYAEAKLALYDDAVIPLANRIFGGLTDFLFSRFNLDPMKARLTFDPDQVTALNMRRITELSKRRSLDCETDNEFRALLGREPYEGGDVVLKPANLIAAGTDIFTEDNDLDVVESTDD